MNQLQSAGYRVIDFFCGAGGMGLGFKQAGFTLAGAYDFDKFAIESYQHNLSTDAVQADIREVKAGDLPTADVWTFGFPCQDISIAGQQRGMVRGETRSGMFYEIMRLLADTREHFPERLPAFIMAENVKQVKKYMDVITEEYRENGYHFTERLYNSKDWGVPQNRERYFMVGVRKDVWEQLGEFVFPDEPEHPIQSLAAVLQEEVPEKYRMSHERSQVVMEGCEPSSADPIGRIRVIGLLDMKGQENIRRVYATEGLAPTLTTSEGGHRQPKVLIATDENQQVLPEPYVRKLTPREYARLQGFPDDYSSIRARKPTPSGVG